MGIQDRDYMRRRESSDSSGEPMPDSSRHVVIGVVAVLALIVGGLFVLSTFTHHAAPKRSSSSERFEQPAPTPFRPVNVNTATADELDAIPYVGPALAEAIIAHRPYATPEELTKVPGIKERMLERIRPYITLK